jgi:hypothetical protein
MGYFDVFGDAFKNGLTPVLTPDTHDSPVYQPAREAEAGKAPS